MSEISVWSTTPAANGTLGSPPTYWPEGQAPSTVNNCARQMMSAIRTQWNDAQWFNWGYTVTRISSSKMRVVSASANTVAISDVFKVNGRLKLYDTSTMYGSISEVSASNTSVNVTITFDSGSLTNSFSSVYNSIITPDGKSIPTNINTSGGLQSIQIFSSGTGATYTPPAGINNIYVELIGGGGAGGGATATGVTFGVGGGGGSGGYCVKYITNIGTAYSATYTIANAVAGVSGAAGNDGEATTWADGTYTLSAGGGFGGAIISTVTGSWCAIGGAGGTSSGGDLNQRGSPGQPGFTLAQQGAYGGSGGSSALGGGADGVLATAGAVAGNDATNGIGAGGGVLAPLMQPRQAWPGEIVGPAL